MSKQKISDCEELADDMFDLYKGDSRNLLDVLSHFPEYILEEGLVDTTITSPPYFDMKDYGYDPDVQVGLNQSYRGYLEVLRDIFKQVYEITKEDGTLWIVANTFKKRNRLYPLPFDIATACQNLSGISHCPECSDQGITVPLTRDETHQLSCENCGHSPDEETGSWILQDIVIWNKGRALPYARKGSFRNVYEYILCFSKSSDFKFNVDRIRRADPSEFKRWWVNYPERYHPRGMLPGNIWEMTTPTQGSWGGESLKHPAPFPEDLVARILRLTTDEEDVVFDPFAGSGMTLAQAEALSRRPLGIEYSEEYCEVYPELRRDVLQQWENGGTDQVTSNAQQDKLQELMGSLQLLRQTRELLRLEAKSWSFDNPQELPVLATFAICRDIRNVSEVGHPFVRAETSIVVEDAAKSVIDTLSESFNQQLNGSQCSKFSVDVTLRVQSRSDAVRRLRVEEDDWMRGDLFVYEEGHHNEYASKASLGIVTSQLSAQSWPDSYRSDEYPPILSNRGLSIPNPKRNDGTIDFNKDSDHLEYGEDISSIEDISLGSPSPAD